MEEEELQHSSESIKHLIFREEPQEVKFPMYHSKFNAKVKAESKRNKECHQTMGLPSDFFLTFPCEYLKKHSHVIQRPLIPKCDPPHQANMSRVPKHDDWKKEKKPEKGDKDYLRNNIKSMANAVPKTGPSRYYDQATNQRYHNCVLNMPKFAYPKIFGKVPKYIREIQKAEQEKKESLRKEREWKKAASALKEVSQEERKQLLEGLKRRWAEMQKEFQLLPMLNDTPPQIKRKLKLERDLAALEREIDHIERNQLIFIIDAPKGYCEIKAQLNKL